MISYYDDQNLTSLPTIKNPETTTQLFCRQNELTSLDLSQLVNLTYLYCDNNKIKFLDLRNCKKLTKNTIVCDKDVVLIWTDEDYEKYMQTQVARNDIEKQEVIKTQNNQTYNLYISQYQDNFFSAEFRINLGEVAIQLRDEDAKAILDYTLSLVKNYISK